MLCSPNTCARARRRVRHRPGRLRQRTSRVAPAPPARRAAAAASRTSAARRRARADLSPAGTSSAARPVTVAATSSTVRTALGHDVRWWRRAEQVRCAGVHTAHEVPRGEELRRRPGRLRWQRPLRRLPRRRDVRRRRLGERLRQGELLAQELRPAGRSVRRHQRPVRRRRRRARPAARTSSATGRTSASG